MEIASRAFISRFDEISNVLVNEVYIDKGVIPPTKIIKHPVRSNLNKYIVIWDTGATNSAVTRKVIDDCGLIPIGRTIVNTASDQIDTGIFLADIYLPNMVVFQSILVTECKLVSEEEVLIGMDIISLGDFAVSNKDGKTSFSYRCPSAGEIDFTKNFSSEKVSRNEPCPCGSGIKHKKCHGKPQ